VDYAQSQRNPIKHLPSITLVVLLHLALGYALVTGLARSLSGNASPDNRQRLPRQRLIP